MKKQYFFAIPATFSILLSGCMLTEMKKNMDEMHDATVSMNGKMDTTNKNMGVTNGGMEETKYISKEMLLGMRPKEARDTRVKEWAALLKGKTMPEKLDAAAAFNYAMEFQGLEPRFEDEADRQALYKAGVEELVQKIRSQIKNRDKTSATQKSEHMENLYAVAAQLHKVSHKQETKARDWGFKPMSTYDVIIEGMKNNWKIDNNEESVNESGTETSTTITGRWMEDVTYLLRVRANFLAAYTFVMMAADGNGDEPSFLDKAWILIKTNLFKKSWSTNLVNRDTKQIQYYNFILNLALTTRNDIMDMRIMPMTDKKIVNILSHIDFSDVDASVDPAKGDQLSVREKRAALQELKDTIAKYTN